MSQPIFFDITFPLSTSLFSTGPRKGTFFIFTYTKENPRYKISANVSNPFYEIVELTKVTNTSRLLDISKCRKWVSKNNIAK